jgi:hypothetical protein
LPCVATQSSCEKTTFLENRITSVWHVYSSRWSDQPSLHLDNSHLKTCFQYYPTKMYSFTHIKGMLHKIKQQILQWRVHSFKKVLHAYSIPYVQTMFDCFRIYRCTFLNLQYFSRGELPTSKGVILKIWFVFLEEHYVIHSEKWCAIMKDHFSFYMLTYIMCSLLTNVKRTLHVQQGSFFT